MKKRTVVKLLIGVPWHKPDQRFIESLSSFLSELKKYEQHYKVEIAEVRDKSLVEAQNIISAYFIDGDFDYLLLIENDNWGFTRNHLKALLSANTEVCAMHYHSRHFPYFSCNMRKIEGRTDEGGPLFAETHTKSGYAECDLVGYGMTLYKRSVFEKLEEPYFRLNKFGGPESYATDIDFSERCKEKGIKLIGCFEYTLNHRDVNKDNVMQLRLDGMKQGRENLLKRKGYMV
jgi:hypothetical protein